MRLHRKEKVLVHQDPFQAEKASENTKAKDATSGKISQQGAEGLLHEETARLGGFTVR